MYLFEAVGTGAAPLCAKTILANIAPSQHIRSVLSTDFWNHKQNKHKAFYSNSKYVTKSLFTCTFFRTQKETHKKQKPTRKDSHNSINIWTTFHLVVSILGLRTNISSWGINFKTIKGKVNMQKNAKPEKEQSWCSPLNGWLSTPLLLWSQEIIPQMPKNAKKGLISMCAFFSRSNNLENFKHYEFGAEL